MKIKKLINQVILMTTSLFSFINWSLKHSHTTILSSIKHRVTKDPPSIIKPPMETWSGRIALSELDQTGETTHVPSIYYYTRSPENWNNFLQTLKNSVSTTLVHFYPLAGRLVSTAGGRLELNCNFAGVQFIEAHANVKLADLDGNLMWHPIIEQLIPKVDYGHTSLEEMPLLLLQVTRFQCGGWSLGFLISHVVVDGIGALHFLSEWARVCRGEPLGPPPYLNRNVLRAGDPPSPTTTKSSIEQVHYAPDLLPNLIGQCNNENERKKKTTLTMLKLNETLVKKLQNKGNKNKKSEGSPNFTRYEVVTAHAWQTACKVRKIEIDQPTSIAFCIDFRNRMNPPLPDRYFGNAIIDVLVTGTSGEIVKETLGYVSSKIRDTIEKVNDEFVNSTIDFLKNQQDLSKFQDLQLAKGDDHEGMFFGNPNMGVASWLTLPLYGIDFGWGKEIFMSPGTNHLEDGDLLVLRGEEGDKSLNLVLCLQVRHMEDFKRVFYQTIEED